MISPGRTSTSVAMKIVVFSPLLSEPRVELSHVAEPLWVTPARFARQGEIR